jgi:hypothetical protein
VTRKERLRKVLKNTVVDLVGELLYFGRKEDEELDRDALDEMFRNGWASAEEIKVWFGEALDTSVPQTGEGER